MKKKFLFYVSLVVFLGCAQTKYMQIPRDKIEAAKPKLNGYYYSVKNGDNLYRISQNCSVNPDQLARINKITDPNKISVGQKLFIPKN